MQKKGFAIKIYYFPEDGKNTYYHCYFDFVINGVWL